MHSLKPDLVTAVCEAIRQIIFPLTWEGPYIPLCPVSMSGYLSSPIPFIIGLDSRFFDYYDQPEDVNAVDLDTNTISMCSEEVAGQRGNQWISELRQHGIKLLPKRAARALRANLVILQEKCMAHNRLIQKMEMEHDDSIDFDLKLRARESALELEIQEAFLQFMVAILGGYRQNLLPITRAPKEDACDINRLFDSKNFLRGKDSSYHRFYNVMMKTQMFTKFIEECSFVSDINTSLAFFDECVERIEREEDGRLLEVEGEQSDRTVFILPPDPGDLPPGKDYKYSTLIKFDHSLFLGPIDEVGDHSNDASNFKTPNTTLAKRTKQEIRSSVKIAAKYSASPLLWAKCLLATSYSIWFIHLPSMALHDSSKDKKTLPVQTLRSGYHTLQRMQRLRLHPVDEICYRVLMQLCGVYTQPVLAVKVLFEMKRHGVTPNAVTYGYYNKAVLESEWPQGFSSSSQMLWHKLRNVQTAVWLFRQAGKARRRRQQEDAEDAVSRLSLESGPGAEVGFVKDQPKLIQFSTKKFVCL